MLALQITNLKIFMNQILSADAFDIFLLEEAIITTASTFSIDGHVNKDFFTAREREEENICPYDFAKWSEIKGLCFHLIKGKHTPLFFKFVLHLMPEHMFRLLHKEHCSVDPSQVKALVLTVKYDGSKAIMTTGSAYHTFLMDKEPELIWDRNITKYLEQKGICFEEL